MVQVAEMRQWRHNYYSLVVQRGMKLCFTVFGQAWRSEGYWLVTVCNHGDFIVLHHWNTMHDLLSHSVALSWHWSKQSLPYPNNAECLAQRATNTNFTVIGFTRIGFENVRSRLETTTFGFPDLPEQEADALLSWPPRLAGVKAKPYKLILTLLCLTVHCYDRTTYIYIHIYIGLSICLVQDQVKLTESDNRLGHNIPLSSVAAL